MQVCSRVSEVEMVRLGFVQCIKYAQLPLGFLVEGRNRASFISVSAICIRKATMVKRNNIRKESSLLICSFLVMWYQLTWPEKLICTVAKKC